MSRKICVVTGTRAEYGLLRWVMEGIRATKGLELQVIATGTHLSPAHGNTYQEIEGDGMPITRRVDLQLHGDTPVAIASAMGVGMHGFAEAYEALKPDMVLVLGDRFEIFAAAAAATVSRIPIAHIHGGESTEGAMDEAFRHAITKMAHIHFVAAEAYRDRVIQLGEQPSAVFLVGGLGVDAIKRVKRMERAEFEASIDFKLGEKSLLVTFHPVTLEDETASVQMQELLAALAPMNDTQMIFTMPNADPGSKVLFGMINAFVGKHDNARVYASLGQRRYLSAIALTDAVVGNSSSGLIEVPAFHKPTVNIGDRQLGRLKAASVIDCAPERRAIAAAIGEVLSPEFQKTLADAQNPYGTGGASEKIVQQLLDQDLTGILKKSFYDMAAL